MKALKLLMILIVLGASLCVAAENHYKNALTLAINSDGTDDTIEGIMAARGFDIDAIDTREPDIIAKVKALFSCSHPAILQKTTDNRGLNSVVYIQGVDTFALDYLTNRELDSLSYKLPY